MKLYDLFYQSLLSSNDFDEAVRVVEREILKRKTTLENSSEIFSVKLEKIMELRKKAKNLEFINKVKY